MPEALINYVVQERIRSVDRRHININVKYYKKILIMSSTLFISRNPLLFVRPSLPSTFKVFQRFNASNVSASINDTATTKNTNATESKEDEAITSRSTESNIIPADVVSGVPGIIGYILYITFIIYIYVYIYLYFSYFLINIFFNVMNFRGN